MHPTMTMMKKPPMKKAPSDELAAKQAASEMLGKLGGKLDEAQLCELHMIAKFYPEYGDEYDGTEREAEEGSKG